MVAGLAAAITAGLALALMTPVATAHPGSDYYPTYKWPINSNVTYYIGDSTPQSGWRNGVIFGLNQWSDLSSGRAPNFIHGGTFPATHATFNPCANNINRVHADNNLAAAIGVPGALGIALTCKLRGTPTGLQNYISRFEMTFERNPSNGWHTGTGNPPNNQWDIRSIASHEAGHATGWLGHFSYSLHPVACPTPVDASVNTMCVGNPNVRGTTWLRTLESHDKHTIANAY